MIVDKTVTQSHVNQCKGPILSFSICFSLMDIAGPSETNCIHRVKPILLMMTTHLACVTTIMYFVTIVTKHFFYYTSIYVYAATVISRVKVLCSSNRRCHDNVSSTVALNRYYKHSVIASRVS